MEAPPCLTCGSRLDCLEDVDQPGDFYCTPCWEEYEQQLLLCAGASAPTAAAGSQISMTRHGGDDDDDDDGGAMILGQPPPSQPPAHTARNTSPVANVDPQHYQQTAVNETVEDETNGSRGAQKEFDTVDEEDQKSLSSQPTFYTQDNGDSVATAIQMTTLGTPKIAQPGSEAAGAVGTVTANHVGMITDNEVVIDNLDAADSSFLVDYNDTTTQDNENGKDDEMAGFGLLTQAAVADNCDETTDDHDCIDDKDHVAPTEGVNHQEDRINDGLVGFAQSIINTHERKTNHDTDQSPLIEALMASTSDSHGESMALSGLTEPTTQPDISLTACENRPDPSCTASVWEGESSATLPAFEQCAVPNYGIPTEKDLTSCNFINNVGYDVNGTAVEDDASSAYNGLSEEEGEAKPFAFAIPARDNIEVAHEHERTENANAGEQQPMSTDNTDSVKQVAPEKEKPTGNTMILMQNDDERNDCHEAMQAACRPVEFTRNDVTVDNLQGTNSTDMAFKLSQQHRQGVSADIEEEEKEKEDMEYHEEGTGDTNVSFGSGYWSLYDGNTQKLPTEPSQVQITSAQNSSLNHSAINMQLDKPVIHRMSESHMREEGTNVCMDLIGINAVSARPSAKCDADDNHDEVNLFDYAAHGEGSDDARSTESMLVRGEDDKYGEVSASKPSGFIRERSSMVDAPHLEERDEDETQLSQDLLASPAAKSNQITVVDDKSTNTIPSTKPCPPQIAETKKETSTASKSLFIQKHNINETEWLPSARNLHGTKETVPLLLMPSPKPQRKNVADDPNEPPLDDSVEFGSDTQSWSGNGHNYSDYTIEDTQNENEARHPSAFKRLSRDSSSSQNFAALKSLSVIKGKSPSKRGGEMISTMKPKILRYNSLTKGDDDSSKSAGTGSSSEAEFDDDFSATRYADHLQSQTDQRILKQLEEVKAILPCAEEIQDIASRKQLSAEIVELKKSYHVSVREKSKLLAQLKVAEETIRQKDKVIKEKNALLDKQYKVIEQIKQACGIELQSPAECNPPAVRTNQKRKKASLPDYPNNNDNDDDDDSDLPLTALGNTNGFSSNKKPRKSPVSNRINVQTNMRRSPTSAARTKKCDAVSADIPLNALSKTTSPMLSTSASSSSRMLAPDVWKQLREKGWKYQTGPEPHNKVYVPKDGATHSGTQLGIHFFDSDQVIAAAIERGDLIDNCSKTTSTTHPGQPIQVVQDQTIIMNPNSDTPMDDSKFCGSLNLLTLESARSCIELIDNFVRNNDHERFVGLFFAALYQRLKEQGTGPEMKWRYDANRNPLAKCSWCFVPPTSNLGSKGKAGYDYFETEEQVALVVLKEVRAAKEVSTLLANRTDTFSAVLSVLERAVAEGLEYLDAQRGNSGYARARRATIMLSNSPDSSPFKQPQKSSSKANSVLENAHKSTSKTTISKITPESKLEKKNTSLLKKTYKPTFHMSQTQGVEAVHPSYNRCGPRKDDGPLRGLNFFSSGVDSSFKIVDRITRLGGKVIQHNSLTLETAHRNTFFLADYNCWRKMKYILANALGVPMLHFQWIAELEQKFQEYGTAKAFDSDLYKKYRLPLGLDLSRGTFPLQRASNARYWDPPGHTKGAGEKLFQGMTIALAIEENQVIDWIKILSACGASVKTLSDIYRGKGRLNVDCCLLASTSLPPHSVSLPDYVSKLLRCLVDGVPLLDLAWAHQSIIQRKRLPVVGNARYAVSIIHDMSSTCRISSIKSKSGARYEIGDLVQFTRGSKTITSGRIASIMYESQGKNCRLEIQLLDSYGDYNLIDCPSAAKITVTESSLKGNILMLDTDDFHNLGYIHLQRNIFNLSSNESQI